MASATANGRTSRERAEAAVAAVPTPTDAPTTDAPTGDADITPPTDAPVTDAPAGDADTPPADTPPVGEPVTLPLPDATVDNASAGAIETAAQRRKREAHAEAKKAPAPRYVLDEGAAWHKFGQAKQGNGPEREAYMGEVAVCRSVANARGESFLYVVARIRGKETAIPLLAIDKLAEADEI